MSAQDNVNVAKHDGPTKKRSDARRKLIINALLAASREPADGSWTHVAQLCRLGVTSRGRKWLGTSVERGILKKDVQQRSEARKGAPDSLDAQEKKRMQDNLLIQKVESWKQALAGDFAASGMSGIPEGLRDVQRPYRTHDMRPSGVVNFKVTKRCAPSNAPKPPNPSQSHLLGQPSPNSHAASGPELSFLPPSFPSHLATSTPRYPVHRKPAPIPRVTVSSPCISSTDIQVYRDTIPPYESQVPRLTAPSFSHTTSKTPAPLPTLTELLVTAKRRRKGRQRRISQSTNSSSPHSTPHSSNRFNSANDNALHERAPEVRALSLGFLDVHDPGGIEFDPLFTSTQRSAPNNDHSSTDRDLWRGYSSQFDINRSTTDVAKFLEKDVLVEY